MHTILRYTLLGAITLPLLHSQTDAARIAGTISDASGAVIQNAIVIVKNEKTGQSRKVSTNEQGLYFATQLQPASYNLKAEAPGMSLAEYSGIGLGVGQERLLNVIMQPSTIIT